MLKIITSHILGTEVIDASFALNPPEITNHLKLWQFVTYMFLHYDFLSFLHDPTDFSGAAHILFNMLALFMFGNELERYWGTPRFITYYFVTGIGAGICSWIVAPNTPARIMGASGAIYGLLLAYGLLYPNRVVYLNFLLPIKVKWLVIIFGAASFLSSVRHDSDVAYIAHLGGMVIGFLYLKGKDWVDRYHYFYEQRQHEQLKRQFEVYYGDVRRKIDDENKKGPTIH